MKMPGQKARPNQIAWGEEIEDHGAVYAVVTSVVEALDVIRMVHKWTERPRKIERSWVA